MTIDPKELLRRAKELHAEELDKQPVQFRITFDGQPYGMDGPEAERTEERLERDRREVEEMELLTQGEGSRPASNTTLSAGEQPKEEAPQPERVKSQGVRRREPSFMEWLDKQPY